MSYVFQNSSYNITVGIGNYTLEFIKEYYNKMVLKIQITSYTETYWQNISMEKENGTLLLNVQGYYGYEHYLIPQIYYKGSFLTYSILNISGESYQELNVDKYNLISFIIHEQITIFLSFISKR